MLTHRTNVLLTEEMYQRLKNIAEKRGKSIGSLIRGSLEQTYGNKAKVNETKKIIERIHKITKKVDLSDIDYKELINDGRRF